MDSETPIVKLIAGAVGLVVVCFCVGFYLLGGRSVGSTVPQVATQPESTPSPLTLESSASPKLSVIETTERKAQGASAGLRVGVAHATDEATPAPTKPTPAPKTASVPSDTSEGAASAGAAKAPGAKKTTVSSDAMQIPAPIDDVKEATPKPDAPDTASPSSEGSLYRVRVKNSFGSHDDADLLAAELKGRGFAASVMPASKGKFQVQIGAYRDKKRAEEKQKELEKNNYDTHISDKSSDDGDGEKSESTKKEVTGEKKSGEG